MSALFTRGVARAVLLAAAVIIASPVIAETDTLKLRKSFDDGLSMVHFPSSSAPPPTTAPARSSARTIHAPATAKFFTINQVLAKNGMRVKSSDYRYAAVNPSGSLSDATLPAPPRGDEPFGLFTFRAPEGVLWVKWRGVQAEIAADLRKVAQCDGDCTPAAGRFAKLIDAAKGKSGRARLEHVNESVNSAILYTSDYGQHRVADHWASPLASFTSGRGDCEDYAIAKYVALREAGTPAADLRLMLVRDRQVRDDHAVLAVRQKERWFILDNRRMAVLEDNQINFLTPLFAADHEGIKLIVAPYAKHLWQNDSDPLPAAALQDAPLRGSISDERAVSAAVGGGMLLL